MNQTQVSRQRGAGRRAASLVHTLKAILNIPMSSAERETARASGHAFGMELSTHDKQDASVGLLIKRLVNSSRVTEERAVAKGCEDS